MPNKLFDRIRLQARLREILTAWGDQAGYEIIHTALEREIQYEQYRKSSSGRNSSKSDRLRDHTAV